MTRDSIGMKIKAVEKRKLALARTRGRTRRRSRPSGSVGSVKPKFAALKDRIIPGLTGKSHQPRNRRRDTGHQSDRGSGHRLADGGAADVAAVGRAGRHILNVQTALRDLPLGRGRRSPIRGRILGASLSAGRAASGGEPADGGLGEAVPGVQGHAAVRYRRRCPWRDGCAVPAVVHAGEGVFTQDQMAAMGGGQTITVVVQDGAVDPNKIRVIAGNETRSIIRREARIGSRGLPGRGGGRVG